MHDKDNDFFSFVLLFLKKAFSVFQKNCSSCLRTCTLTSINVYFNFFFFPLASYLLCFLFYFNFKKKKKTGKEFS